MRHDEGERTSASVLIGAPARDIMAVIADVAAYPQWVEHLTDVEVLSFGPAGLPLVARFVLRSAVLADDYTLAYEWSDDEVSWRLVEGKSIKAMDGSYRLRPADGGTQVEYSLSIALDMPLLGAFRRKAESVVIGAALNALKARVEPCR